MKHSTRTLLGFICAMGLLVGRGYSADQQATKASKTEEQTNLELDAAWKRRIPRIDFNGSLPLGYVAERLREHFPEMNFVLPENAVDTLVPTVVLRNVTLNELLKAIELASMGRIRVNVPQDSAPKMGPDGLPIPSATARQNIVAFMVSRPSGEPRSTPTCRVFSLAPYLEGRSEKEAELAIKELYDALDIAWQMLKKGGAPTDRPTLSIHGGTKLLIAVGRDQELTVIDQVVKQLQGSPARTAANGRFTVLGEVMRPGTYDIPGEQSINLLQALSKAGGPTRIGNLKKVTVQRGDGAEKKVFNVDAEAMMKGKNTAIFEVLAGDTITVGEKLY